MMQTKDYRFEVKSVNEDGTFEGYLSVFNVVDLVNDVVEPGAFTKTIQDQKGVVPMLWQHDTKQPIGTLELAEDDYGLKVKGRLVMEVERAREAYALLKAGVIKGLSIGFQALQEKADKGIRRLKEIKLFEGSVVTFPALPVAQITSVKADEDIEEKAGRRLSAATRAQLQAALSNVTKFQEDIQALLAEDEGTSDEAAKAEPQNEAADTKSEPDALHSWLAEWAEEFKSALKQ